MRAAGPSPLPVTDMEVRLGAQTQPPAPVRPPPLPSWPWGDGRLPAPRAGLFGALGTEVPVDQVPVETQSDSPILPRLCGEILTRWELPALCGVCDSLQKAGHCFHQGATSVKRRISNREVRKAVGRREPRCTRPRGSAAQASRKVRWGGCPACRRRARWSCHQRGGGAPGPGSQLDVWARASGPQLGVRQARAQLPGLSPQIGRPAGDGAPVAHKPL